MPDIFGNPTLRDHFPIFCRNCKKKILGQSYRVLGILIQENGIPVSLYCHRDCFSDAYVTKHDSYPVFENVAHCVYCGEPTNSNEFECEACKQRVKYDLRKNGELSEAAREFIAALAQMRQAQLAEQHARDGDKNKHPEREFSIKSTADRRDIEVARALDLPDATPEDFGPFVPTNENGVVYIAGSIAKDLGYRASYIGNSYPDAIFVSPSQQLLKVEFEFASGNFILHGHDPALCDMVICWKKDRELPVPVLELSRYYDTKTGRWDFRRAADSV
jgi:gas vesicle GvpC-like protein